MMSVVSVRSTSTEPARLVNILATTVAFYRENVDIIFTCTASANGLNKSQPRGNAPCVDSGSSGMSNRTRLPSIRPVALLTPKMKARTKSRRVSLSVGVVDTNNESKQHKRLDDAKCVVMLGWATPDALYSP